MAALEILYFAWVREGIGKDGETIDHPGGDVTVGELIARLAERGGGYAQVFADVKRVRAALDQNFVPLDTRLGTARELALFPPVTGG
ncbi:MAG: MoaD/ThiS family protein [Sphingobium sp.]|nr:MoaD/ThiS family protein [Sphingobium sp.]MBP6112684.1 MoaD/ThiS family protein [Sphingobium sp.]MBP8672015.1 MoaD/ThiS family protein [Sphingobium sp.]MBP9158434.1 MoaD/ThiS family protein [Sphingobium sp.]